MEWMGRQNPAEFFTSAMTQTEVLTGLALLPSGKRKTNLEAAATRMFTEDFSGRVLAFDQRAAPIYAGLVGARTRRGLPTPTFDMMIAAIAQLHGATVATRNVKHFADCGVPLRNPWLDED